MLFPGEVWKSLKVMKEAEGAVMGGCMATGNDSGGGDGGVGLDGKVMDAVEGGTGGGGGEGGVDESAVGDGCGGGDGNGGSDGQDGSGFGGGGGGGGGGGDDDGNEEGEKEKLDGGEEEEEEEGGGQEEEEDVEGGSGKEDLAEGAVVEGPLAPGVGVGVNGGEVEALGRLFDLEVDRQEVVEAPEVEVVERVVDSEEDGGGLEVGVSPADGADEVVLRRVLGLGEVERVGPVDVPEVEVIEKVEDCSEDEGEPKGGESVEDVEEEAVVVVRSLRKREKNVDCVSWSVCLKSGEEEEWFGVASPASIASVEEVEGEEGLVCGEEDGLEDMEEGELGELALESRLHPETARLLMEHPEMEEQTEAITVQFGMGAVITPQMLGLSGRVVHRGEEVLAGEGESDVDGLFGVGGCAIHKKRFKKNGSQ